MVVWTQTPKLQKMRRNVMELYVSDHPLDCMTCPANGDCEFQDMAGVVGLRQMRYGTDGANHFDYAKDESNPYFTYDPASCIMCSRCIRACDERSEEHTSELQSLMRISYAVFCLKTINTTKHQQQPHTPTSH